VAVGPALALLLSGCQNGGGSSPTEPGPALSSLTASAAVADEGALLDDASLPAGPGAARAAARIDRAAEGRAAVEPGTLAGGAAIEAARGGNGGSRGNGGGNGNGNGGNGNGNGGNGGNGGGRGNGQRGELNLQIQPATWNLNWEHSSGLVSALIRGADAADIDTDSVVLVCELGTEVQPVRVQLAGGQLRAFFLKSDAIGCLDDPDPREVHEVTVRFTVDGGAAQELTADVRIVGAPGGGDDEDDTADEVDAQVQPNTWNVNWAHADGTVSILLRGDITDVDEDTIVLVGSAGTEVQPVSVKRVGNHIRARFPMDEAFASLDDPDSGEVHEIVVKFMDDAAASHEITLRVRIVGPR
jgi:hypothetical protein